MSNDIIDALGILGIDLDKPSPYDYYTPEDIEEDAKLNGMQQKKDDKPSITPHIDVKDRNNDPDDPYINKPIPAIEVGVNFSF